MTLQDSQTKSMGGLSAAANLLAQLVSYPLYCIKTNMQVASNPNPTLHSNSMRTGPAHTRSRCWCIQRWSVHAYPSKGSQPRPNPRCVGRREAAGPGAWGGEGPFLRVWAQRDQIDAGGGFFFHHLRRGQELAGHRFVTNTRRTRRRGFNPITPTLGVTGGGGGAV